LVRAIDGDADTSLELVEEATSGRPVVVAGNGGGATVASGNASRAAAAAGDATASDATADDAGRPTRAATGVGPGAMVAAGAGPRRLAAVGSRVEDAHRPSRSRRPGSRAESRSFEATPAGVRHFEEWLLRSSTAPPLRDELHMKVALCQPHNLPRLVELVYGQELICLARVQELKRTFERMRPPAPNRWSGLVLVHIRDAELSFWEARLTWLQGIRASLESMHAEYQRATKGERLAARAGVHAPVAAGQQFSAIAAARPKLAQGAQAIARRSAG
jgi:hypothetical protein